ncbi:MAG: formyltransferase family protein [Chitinophagales bacterium]
MTKIIFMGSKPIGYRCLQYLIEQVSPLNLEIIGVFTKAQKHKLSSGEHNFETLCKQHQIPCYFRLSDLLSLEKVNLIVSVQYHKILKQIHIDQAQQAAINLHMASLPEYRGCNQFSFAIANDATIFGTTLHLMTAGIDSGDILFEKRFPIPPNCFVQDLYKLTVEHSYALFCSHIVDLVKQNYEPISQESLIATRGTSYHYRHEINELKKIDLTWEKDKIERHFRATYFPPFEPPFTVINGETVYLSKNWKEHESDV